MSGQNIRKRLHKKKSNDILEAQRNNNLRKKEECRLEIKKPALAGTLESSDCMVTVEPGNGGIELDLDSSVIRQYGKQIRKVILATLERLEVSNARITVVDKGALDCTIKARVECAVYRANDQKDHLPWGGAIV